MRNKFKVILMTATAILIASIAMVFTLKHQFILVETCRNTGPDVMVVDNQEAVIRLYKDISTINFEGLYVEESLDSPYGPKPPGQYLIKVSRLGTVNEYGVIYAVVNVMAIYPKEIIYLLVAVITLCIFIVIYVLRFKFGARLARLNEG